MIVGRSVPPDRMVVVAGTGTEVGKTWVTAGLAGQLRACGVSVAARKPVQSFEPGAGPTDAEVLAAATGEDARQVCPPGRWLPVPMAPPIAAAILGWPSFTVGELAGELRWPVPVAVGLVEMVGGVRSPLAEDGDTVAFVAATTPDLVVVVADARLGAIHAVRCAVDALDRWPVVVLLNRFERTDPVHEHNRRWLADRDAIDVTVDLGAIAERIRSLAVPRTC